MRKKNMTAVREAMAKAYADQIKRAFDVARVRGYKFPEENVEVAVSVLEASPVATQVQARIGTLAAVSIISDDNTKEDIAKAVDALVDQWLEANATSRPS